VTSGNNAGVAGEECSDANDADMVLQAIPHRGKQKIVDGCNDF
jgi:hypothetical protein